MTTVRRRIQPAEVAAVPADSTVEVEPLGPTAQRSLLLAVVSVALLGPLGFVTHQFTVAATLTVGFGGSYVLGSRRIRSVERRNRAVLLRRIEPPFSRRRAMYTFRPD